MTPTQKERILELVRQAGSTGDSMLQGFSGADQADSEAYFCARRVYVDVYMGTIDLEVSIAREDARWRAYAAEQSAKVDEAPKVKRGPMSGHSAISHRWVSPEKFSGMAHHIRAMVKAVLFGVDSGVKPT